MKARTFTRYLALAFASLSLASAADVQYSVVAFPKDQTVSVIVNGQPYPLTASSIPNLFKGSAPYAPQYQYALTGGSGDVMESNVRQLAEGVTTTGNEFFNRTRTVYNVPDMPQAYHPIFPPLMSNMNRSDEIATIILEVNGTGLNEILQSPLEKLDYTEVYKMHYISSTEEFTYTDAGIKNSGASSRMFAKQSYKIKLNEFKQVGNRELIYGRTTIKLRAHETDPTFIREKLMLDCLLASGAAASSASWARLFINNEPYGLFLMVDDATTSFIDSILHAGNRKYEYTGITYKGNAVDPMNEGNLVFINDSVAAYPDATYKVEDIGVLKKKDLAKLPAGDKTALIEFIRALSTINPTQIVDEASAARVEQLIHPTHAMIHLAMNFLSGSWDGAWYQASNYYINQDLQSNQWNLITYDFDETMGNQAPKHFIDTPYTNFSRPDSQRPLVDLFIKSPYYAPKFEEILVTLCKRFFKPSVLTPRIQAWGEMLRQDIEWDLSIPAKSPGDKPTWTIWNFENNLINDEPISFGVNNWITQRSAATLSQLGATDVDDLPVLGPYTGGAQWDPYNYQTTDADGNDVNNAGAAMPTALGAIIISALVGVFQFLL